MGFFRVGQIILRGWGRRYPRRKWLWTLGNMAEYSSKWRSRVRSDSASPKYTRNPATEFTTLEDIEPIANKLDGFLVWLKRSLSAFCSHDETEIGECCGRDRVSPQDMLFRQHFLHVILSNFGLQITDLFPAWFGAFRNEINQRK